MVGKARSRKPSKALKKRSIKLSSGRLDEMIEEATVDCYGESEEACGLFTMLEENLAMPFTTMILGLEVQIVRIDITVGDQIVAICRRGKERQRIPILDLPLPDPRPEGSEWIDAIRRWTKR